LPESNYLTSNIDDVLMLSQSFQAVGNKYDLAILTPAHNAITIDIDTWNNILTPTD
jgi:hypothetical protein